MIDCFFPPQTNGSDCNYHFYFKFCYSSVSGDVKPRLILGGNEFCHLSLLHSIVHDNSVEMKSERGFDKSFFKEKYYSNKPPGYSFLLSFPYYLYIKLLNSEDIWDTFVFLKIMNAIFSSTSLVLIFAILSMLKVKPTAIILGILAASFGTIFPAYSVLVNSIPLSVMLCLSAFMFYLLFCHSKEHKAIYWFISFFCINYAVFTDYTNGFFLFPLFVVLILNLKKKYISAVIFGAMPLIVFAIYNYLVFDNPFALTYSYYSVPDYVNWRGVSQSMSLLNIPDGFFGILLSPSRSFFNKPCNDFWVDSLF